MGSKLSQKSDLFFKELELERDIAEINKLKEFLKTKFENVTQEMVEKEWNEVI